ncbi:MULTISPECIES: hypothetical protein [Burkholderia]|uniref:Uncharacterized protein n=1 Tax=Burkholderia sola TaxID=2843302 RepID=A0ABV2CIA4_9BURK|nr:MULTISPECIES: hypothetical protein [unclassified Burkholderia]MBP0610888.1 hypothetical protein [Burkholderia sp. CpTa8-5]QVN10290.1 hypothetical protein JYG37_13185 [Burkholderia sp. LAS2]RQV58394.1 hypothetical protein DF024_26035 [Burkholderia cenocepacia]
MTFHVSENAFHIGSIPDQISVSSRDIATIHALQGELRTCIYALRGALEQKIVLDTVPGAEWFWQRAEAATDELDIAINKAIGWD